MASDIFTLAQQGIPLVARPFQVLATQLQTTEEQVLATLDQAQKQKVIRQISPIYDTKMLGYDSSLVAFAVACERIEAAASIINQHPGVSHNYERAHKFNLWFTLAVPPESRLGLENTVALLREETQAEDFLLLRSQQVFKIRVCLQRNQYRKKEQTSSVAPQKDYQPLSVKEKNIIRHTQRNLPLVSRPFREWALELEMGENELLDILQDFQQRGVMRRLAAVLYHRRAGFTANGMTVWQIPSPFIAKVGAKIASFSAVSHCYERSSSAKWPYNLFAMIHGQSHEEVSDTVAQIDREIAIAHYRIFYSLQEFKKKRLQYFIPDYDNWEQHHQLAVHERR